MYAVKKNDSLYSISGRDGSTWQYLAKRNNLNPLRNLSIGQSLVVNNRHIIPQTQIIDGLLLNIAEHMLYLFEQGILIQRFPVGVGRPDWPTPVGFFKIIGKYKNPTWTVPKSIQEEMIREGKIVSEKVPAGAGQSPWEILASLINCGLWDSCHDLAGKYWSFDQPRLYSNGRRRY